MRRTTFLFLVLVTFALMVVTFNTGSLIVKFRPKLTFPGVRSLTEDTSGKYFDPLVRMPDHLKLRRGQNKSKRLFHVVVTANESKYNKWQCRIMYYWYKKFKNHPDSEMGGFTRLLHSGTPDDVMDEIPTFAARFFYGSVSSPLVWKRIFIFQQGYVVLNRPWAFVQWLEKATIEEEYILMAEPDHIFIRPMPNMAALEMPAAFPFLYIEPKENEQVLRKFFPRDKGPITNIDPIGNSLVIIKQSQLKKIAPTWLNTSISMKSDPEADSKFGWVLEMYGYATASAWHGVQHILRKDFMLQPPWDTELGESYIIHYTYGCDYNMKGEMIYGQIGEWRFDKRSYTHGAPPRNLPLPPPGVPETVVTLIKAVNEATANIPNWVEGE